MPLFSRWRAERDLQRKAERYVARLLAEPEDLDVRWLAESATRGDLDHARWELRYARRALGLIVAERDAPDDRTASAVARTLSEALPRDPNIAPSILETSERQFNARRRAERQGLDVPRGAAP